MVLDPNLPKDDLLISDIARYIRETRQAILNDREQYITAIPVEFGTEDYDAVFLDVTSNTFRRSKAGDPTRNKFHGFYIAADAAVKVSGYVQNDAWSFVPGSNVYISTVEYGNLVSTETELDAGITINEDTIIITSSISSKLTGVLTAIEAIEAKDLVQDAAIAGAEAAILAEETRVDALVADVTPLVAWKNAVAVFDTREVLVRDVSFIAEVSKIYTLRGYMTVVTAPINPPLYSWFTIIPQLAFLLHDSITIDFTADNFQGLADTLIYDATRTTTFVYLGGSYGWSVLN